MVIPSRDMKDQRGGPKVQPLTVALRFRPMNEAEINEEASVIAHKLGEQMVILRDPLEDPDDILRAHRSREKTFIFDMVFDEKATQEEVYVSTTKKLIEGVISGYNATVFAYGPTGAGKTYTMLGMDCEPGIYIQTLNDLFKDIDASSNHMQYTVSMSYLEIYNELIRDLLNPSSGFLELREDSHGCIQVAGITEVSTNNAKKIMQLLTKGNKQRTQEPTAANKTSSRSHAVLQVKVKHMTRVKENSEEVRVGRLFMIDLAGSERASQTQNRGKRMKEGAHINRSLLALGNCITALSEKGGIRAHFVNFRDSKLTRLLKDSLDGNCRTVMIAHISPASTSFEESRTTLMYAYRAKNIKTRVKRNLQNVSYHVAQYTNIIADLRKEIKRLKCKVELQENKKGNKRDIRDIQAEVQQSSQVYSRQEMDRLRDQLVGAFNEQKKMRHSLMELEKMNIELHIDTSRHLLTISDWERAKSRQASKFQKQASNDSGVDDMEADRGVNEGGEFDSPEPQEVGLARAEIRMLLAQQQKTENLKTELEQRLLNTELKVSQIEGLLPKLISNGDQQEVLKLLCKVHELEVGNTEFQAGAMCKENLLCQKDFVIQRYQQHRSLCEEIIRQQRALIEDQEIPIPPQLKKLYHIYFRELEEGTLNRLVHLHSVMANKLRDGSVLKAAQQLSFGDSNLQLDTVQHEHQNEHQNGQVKFDLPPIVFESDSNRTSKSSTSQMYSKQDSNLSPTALPIMGPSSQQRQTELVLKDIISFLRSPTSLDSDSRQSAALNSGTTLSPEALEEITVSTKSISLVAARRRSRVQVLDSSHGGDQEKSDSRLSVHFLEDMDDSKYMQQIYTPDYRMQGVLSADSMTAEPQRKAGERNAQLLLKTTEDLKKRSLREVPVEREGNKKRFHSLETVSQGESFKNTPVHKINNVSGLTPIDKRYKLILQSQFQSSLSQSTPPATKVKFPISKGAADGALQVLEVTSKPPIIVHQSNTGQSKGQILQKRVKGPSGSVNTHPIKATSGNSKQRPGVTKQSQPKPDVKKRK